MVENENASDGWFIGADYGRRVAGYGMNLWGGALLKMRCSGKYVQFRIEKVCCLQTTRQTIQIYGYFLLSAPECS